jgi:hypothetical protein
VQEFSKRLAVIEQYLKELMMGLSFPNPIRAAQNFASGAQKSISNTVQSAQKSIGNTVNQTKSFASQQINNVQKQAQGLQNQVGSFANKAQKSLSSAYQNNVAKPLQQAKSQIGSSLNSAQRSLSSSYQSNVAKPLHKAQSQLSTSFNNTQKSLNNSFQSNVAKPLQKTQSQLSTSFNNTQKSLGNSFQSNVVKPFQATQNKIEQGFKNTQKQIGQTSQQLQKNFNQGLQNTQKQLGLTSNSVQKQLNKGLEGKTGYQRFSQIADNVLTGGEKFGKKLANFNQVGGVPRNAETYKLNVIGEGINLVSGLGKGIGTVANGSGKWFSDAKNLASGKQQFSKKDAAAATFSSFGKLGYGMVSGVGDLASRIVAPGKGHDAYAKASNGLQKSLDDSYKRDVTKLGVNPNSTSYKTVNNGLDVAGAIGTLLIPGGKAIKGGGALVKVEQGAAATSRIASATEAVGGLKNAVGSFKAGKIGAKELNAAISDAQGAYKAGKSTWTAEQKAGLAKHGAEANKALAAQTTKAEQVGAASSTAKGGGAKGSGSAKAREGGSNNGANGANPSVTPGGAIIKPTPHDAIRATLSWLKDVQGPSVPKGSKATPDLVSARDRVNDLLGGRSPQSLTDRQTGDLYRGVTNSKAGEALSKSQSYMEQLSNRFSTTLEGQAARTAQSQFNQVRTQLAGKDSQAATRALSRVDIEVNGKVTGAGYKDSFFTTSGKLDLNKLPSNMHSTKTSSVEINGQKINFHEEPLHPTYRAPKNERVFEAEAAAFQQVERKLAQLEDSGVLARDGKGNVEGRGVKVNITLDRISCPSCGAGVPAWLNDIRAAYPNIDLNIRYLK